MATLSYRSAAKIAVREMRSSKGKFFFVILSVAIGVAALTGVRGFSSSFRATLLNRARSIMAADLSARMFMQPTPEQQRGLDEIEQQGIEMTPVTELLSMASAAKTLDPFSDMLLRNELLGAFRVNLWSHHANCPGCCDRFTHGTPYPLPNRCCSSSLCCSNQNFFL